jgi:hypothetical protein
MDMWDRQLERDLDWREAELASLKVLVSESPTNAIRHQALLRALVALLYAHYEGFCKFAWDTYLDHLTATGVDRDACVEEIARYSLADSFRNLRGDLSLESMWQYCSADYIDMMARPVTFVQRLETDSNLWPDVCRHNSAQVHLPHAAVDRHRSHLRALVSRRNHIAHGQPMVIGSLDEYQRYENAAIEVMYELALGISDCLSGQQYLKVSSS